MSEIIDVLAAPNGTQLDPLARKLQMPELANPAAILTNARSRQEHVDLLRRSLAIGATAIPMNTFRLRHAAPSVYMAAAQAHRQALAEALAGHGDTSEILKIMAVGPAAHDCYRPETAPDRKDAYDLHRFQAEVARKLDVDFVLFETIATVREALAAAEAISNADIQGVISFVVGHDGNLLSGESPGEAIRAILTETGGACVRAFGINCSPIEAVEPALVRCGENASRVKVVYPNASSFPQLELEGRAEAGEVMGVIDRRGVAAYLNGLAKKRGLEIIGGCCGFEVDDVGAIVHAVKHGISQRELPRTDLSQR